MKRWTNLVAVAVATATVIVLSLSSVSPGSPGARAGSQTAAAGSLSFTPHAVARPTKSETLFYPVTPCRIIDTRSGGGIMTDSHPRNFYVTGTTGFAPQGGTSGGCGIPTAATGISTNVTTAATAADGYLTGYPSFTVPATTNLISTHKGFTITASPTLALTAGTAQPLTIEDHGGSTQVIVDVTGYYIPQIQGFLTASGISAASTRILSLNNTQTGYYLVTVDGNITGCSPEVTSSNSLGQFVLAVVKNSNQIIIEMADISSSGQLTPVSGSVYLTVTC